jgi:tRNA(Ile)-lysidine synthase
MHSARTFLTRFHEFCRRRRLLEERDKVIVAVSGGADSIVLLDLLARERPVLGIDLIIAHFNHQLRGAESDGDEAFVTERGRQLGIDVFVERAQTGQIATQTGTGIQEAARLLRYDFFERLLASSGFSKIVTAHNADDNAETVLLHLFRGAGVQGLSGIPVYRRDAHIARPLLFATREEIEEYAREMQLAFRTDSSNKKDDYTRNLIRHRVLPLVKEHVNPGVVQTLQRSAELFRELEAFLVLQARNSLSLVVTDTKADEVRLSITRLRSHPVLIQQYVMMAIGEDVTHRKLTAENVASVLGMMDGMTGTWVQLGESHVVFRDRDALVFRKTEAHRDFRIVVRTDQRYEFAGFRFASTLLTRDPGVVLNGEGAEYVDADRLKDEELVLRTWRDGDVFVPLGMKTHKKISDYFVDAKIPLFEKRSYPLLETRQGDVVWLCGQRLDDRFKVNEATQRVLKLEFSRSSQEADGKVPHSER